MPLFLVNARDKANSSDLRKATRQAHLDWAGEFRDKMSLGGPVLSDDGETMIGSTFVIEFDTLDEAKAWVAEDPYTKAGLFERTEIVPFKWLLGNVPSNG